MRIFLPAILEGSPIYLACLKPEELSKRREVLIENTSNAGTSFCATSQLMERAHIGLGSTNIDLLLPRLLMGV